MWTFNFANRSLCRLILLAGNDSIACHIQGQLHTGVLAEPVHRLLPCAARKCRAVCLTDELQFLLLYTQRAAILNCPNQILYLSNNKTGACDHCKCLWSLRLHNGRFSVSIPQISPSRFYFFFLVKSNHFEQGTRKSYFLTSNVSTDLYICWKAPYSEHILGLIFTGFVTEHNQWWVPVLAILYKQSVVVYVFVQY